MERREIRNTVGSRIRRRQLVGDGKDHVSRDLEVLRKRAAVWVQVAVDPACDALADFDVLARS
jgi:hypothetical protein